MIEDTPSFRLAFAITLATVPTIAILSQADIITVDDDDPAADFATGERQFSHRDLPL